MCNECVSDVGWLEDVVFCVGYVVCYVGMNVGGEWCVLNDEVV